MHDHLIDTTTVRIGDWLPTILILLAAAAYLYAALHARHSMLRPTAGQLACFLFGGALVAGAMSPALMHAAHADLRMHMVQHLLIAMYAPIFLVLGAPVTVLLRAVPVRVARGLTGLMKSGAARMLAHPATALLLNVGGMFLLYLTPLYAATLHVPLLHYAVHLHFLLAGYLFTWSIIGLDHIGARPGFRSRLAFLFLSMALHAFLSKLMYARHYPRGTEHSEVQIEEAAKLMYYWGDLSELLLVVILFYAWYVSRRSGRAALQTQPDFR